MAMVIGEVLASAAEVVPAGIAATLDEQTLTFHQLDERANATANALAGLGLGIGDRVLWWSDMSLRSLEVFGGLARVGAVFAPAVATLGVDELVPVAAYLRPRLVLADAKHAEVAADVAGRVDAPLAVVESGGRPCPGIDLDELTDKASSSPPHGPGPGETDLHAMFLTSGSTGLPKGVMLTHRTDWLRCFPGIGPRSQSGGPGIVCMFPLSHFAGWQLATSAWARRRPVHLVHRADASALLAAVERWRANELYGIPAIWGRILDHDRSRFDLGSLRFADTGTSATPVELLTAIKEAFPATATTVNYGSTEAGAVASLADEDLFSRPGSVGRASPGHVVRIAEDGEICVRGDLMMEGYFERPEETAEVLRDGWYHTGDLGSLDEDGYLSVHGRKREIIRSGGETIAPAEVEVACSGCPGVREVAVVGLPDPKWGEVVCAVVVLEDGQPPPTVETLRAHVEGRLAPHKHPRQVLVVEALPRTNATGQVRRSLLREIVATAR